MSACRFGNNHGVNALRNARLLARFLLVWFALYLGVALASPMVAPQAFELVCSSAGGTKLVVKGADGAGAQDLRASAMDCPLCLTGAAPPAVTFSLAPLLDLSLSHVLRSIPAARLAAQVAAPLPARGPPALS